MLFISYSSADRAIATEVYQRLVKQGYQLPFLDYHPDAGIRGGTEWERELRWQLKVARGLIVLCSKNWLQSHWCFAELDRAKEFDKQIIPLNLDQLELPGSISRFQQIPFHVRNEAAYQRLFDDLGALGLNPGDDFYWSKSECPYPGFAVFQEEHAGVYFGRKAELENFSRNYLQPLRESDDTRLIYVIGPSGSGKSSFIRAGVLPRLKYKSEGHWRILTLFRWNDLKRVGQSWSERLAGDILGLYQDHPSRPNWSAEERMTRYSLDDSETSCFNAAQRFVLDVKDLQIALGDQNVVPLIVLDQFEELLSTTAGQSEQSRFLLFLRHCLTSANSPCRAIATVRSDFLPSIQERADLIEWSQSTRLFRLDLMKTESFFEVVRRPAEAVGVRFDTDALVNQIVDEARSADALPLLAFTLNRFYSLCSTEGVLTTDEYQTKLGGLKECLKSVAERILIDESQPDGRVDPVAINALKTCFLVHLSRYHEGSGSSEGVFVKQVANWDDLPQAAYPLLEKMNSDQFRLVRIDRRKNSPTTIEVTHESLFRVWPMLREWLEESREDRILFQRIEGLRERWQANGRHDADVCPAGLVFEALKRIKMHPELFDNEASKLQIEYLEISRKFHEANLRRLKLALVVACLLMIGAGVGFFLAYYRGVQLDTVYQKEKTKNDLHSSYRLMVSTLGNGLSLASTPESHEYISNPKKWNELLGQAEKLEDVQELTLVGLDRELDTLDGLSRLRNLKQLTIQKSDLRTLDVTGLSFLEKLNISGCQSLESITGLSGCPQTNEFVLSDCPKVVNLAGVEKLARLQILDLSFNDSLKDISWLNQLQNLRTLTLESCHAIQGERDLSFLKGLRNLTSLDVTYSSIESLNGLCDAASINQLSAKYCSNLTDIGGVKCLPKLEALNLVGSTKVSDLNAVKECSRLTNLKLGREQQKQFKDFLKANPKIVAESDLQDLQSAIEEEEPPEEITSPRTP